MAFAAMLMAGLDGIENKMDPGLPLDKDIYELEPRSWRASRRCPARSKTRSTPCSATTLSC